MRRSTTALAAIGSKAVGTTAVSTTSRRACRRLAPLLLGLTCVALLLIGGAPGASASKTAFASGKATTFSGSAFDACNAPKTTTLQAWLASPYRAFGIYIGGTNRACANVQLSADWTAAAVGLGWNLIPLYVGLQAPCASKAGLAKLSAGAASAQGTAAADDAAAESAALGLPGGSPIYFDMEAYSLNNAACTQAVLTFISAWVSELHAQGFLAGVYGSAASTIHDLQALTTTSTSPDDVWIADWNGIQTVLGDPYIADTAWPNHQRIHQYSGAHRESWGGITIDIDSSVVDAAVVGATGVAPAPPVTAPSPTPTPVPTESAAGSVSGNDGLSTASWQAGAFRQPVIVNLTPATPTTAVPGFGSGGYDIQLQVTPTSSATLGAFASPVTIAIGAMPGNLAPLFSTDGTSWRPLVALTSAALPPGVSSGYLRASNGSLNVLTTVPGYFALLPELSSPPAPADLTGRFSHGQLLLGWQPSSGAAGPAVSYQVTLSNSPLGAAVSLTSAAVSLHRGATSVYRVLATDAAGKVSRASQPIVVLPAKRPLKIPKALPHWAFELFKWQQDGHSGPRPTAPRIVPQWYWTWAAWQAAPFRFRD